MSGCRFDMSRQFHFNNETFDIYRKSQRRFLLRKLQLLFDPLSVSELIIDNERCPVLATPSKQANISNLEEVIWNQAKYTNDILMMNIHYIVIPITGQGSKLRLPIFIIKKCFTTAGPGCKTYINQKGDLYDNFDDCVKSAKKSPEGLIDHAQFIETMTEFAGISALVRGEKEKFSLVNSDLSVMEASSRSRLLICPKAPASSLGLHLMLFKSSNYPLTLANLFQLSTALFLFSHSVFNLTKIHHLFLKNGGSLTFDDLFTNLYQNPKTLRDIITNPFHQIYTTEVFVSSNELLSDFLLQFKLENYVPFINQPRVLISVIDFFVETIGEVEIIEKLIVIAKIVFGNIKNSLLNPAFEDLLYDVYFAQKATADRYGIDVKRTIRNFECSSWDNIPDSTKKHFEIYMKPLAGNFKCIKCNGTRYCK